VVKKSTDRTGEAGVNIELGGLFRSLGDAVDLLGKLVEVGTRNVEHQGEFTVKGLGDKAGLGGEGTARVEPFGNVHATEEGLVVDEAREPLVDVFDEGGEVVITAELPGANEEEITAELRGDTLVIQSSGERRYAKDVPLPCAVDPGTLRKKYNNGVLELRARKA
jgi:HSP20 family protein